MSGNPSLPPCPGPKLHAFKYQDAEIQWGPRIDEERAGESGTEGFVFRVQIKSKTYALKVFKFFDPEDNRYFWEPYLGDSYPVEKVIFYTDPFYAECRAFGRIQQAYNNREIHHRRVLAVKCHGYIFLSKQDQLELEKRGCDFEGDSLDDGILRASGGNGRVRAIVKDLEPETGPIDAKNIRTAFARVHAINELGIYNRDVRAQNFVNCRLVDFGLAWTKPHEILGALSERERRGKKLNYRVMFDEMITTEKIRTRLKVFDKTGYRAKLRSRTKPLTNKSVAASS
ncbi:kinetochore Sim4 complex subunit FTA2-domain-containing protein [Nemania abortiva]|nr:kinetochore Sim4 complex subunit FTA2-domain-containing protein [Nemania abortiva]